MAAFILVPGLLRYVFSLAALLLGLRFFKSFESIASRVGFVLLVLAFSLFLPAVYVMLALANGWPVPPDFLKGVNVSK